MAEAEWIYLEGYRFDGPDSHEAFAKAIAACKGAGGRVSITLSDPFCIERHRDAFRQMIVEDVDLLFANRAEMLSMYQTEDFDAALKAAAAEVAIVACTDSEKGAHVLSDGQHWHVPAVPTKIVDATGAGDLFAGAFLWGLTNGHDLETCGRMGNIAASEVISHIGARPEADLRALVREARRDLKREAPRSDPAGAFALGRCRGDPVKVITCRGGRGFHIPARLLPLRTRDTFKQKTGVIRPSLA